MKGRKSRRGSVVLTAVGVAFVLLVIIAALQMYSSQRIRATTMETRNFMALCVAEGGVGLIQSELRINPGFTTHKVEKTSDKFTWGNPLNPVPLMDSQNNYPHNLIFGIRKNGSYDGGLGNGQFKVRCGVIPCNDDPETTQVDESKCFFKVEAMGKVNDAVRRVEAVIQRRFIGREFLVFSGGSLSLIYGMNKDKGYNVFSKGHLYGHNLVETGKILRSAQAHDISGTDQKFEEIEFLKSGIGGIFLFSPIDFSFRKGLVKEKYSLGANFTNFRNFTFSQGQERKWGGIPNEMERKFPAIPEQVQKFLMDGSKGNSAITVTPIDFERFGSEAQKGGLFLSPDSNYPLPNGFPPSSKKSAGNKDEVSILDFGNEATGRPSSPPNLNPGNGIIYSPASLVIKGNPKQDLYILAEGNIYVSGDFNQGRGDVKSFPEDRYGLAQYYHGDPLEDYQYSWNYKDDENPKNPGYRLAHDDSRKIRRFVMVAAKERMVYDYRNPLDCFENELFPFVKARIGHVFSGAPNAGLAADLLKVRPPGSVESDIKLDISESATQFKDRLLKVFSTDNPKELKFSIFSPSDPKWSAYTEKCLQAFKSAKESNNSLKESVLDDLTRELMTLFREAYKENPKNKAFGKLVQGLIREVDKAGFGNKEKAVPSSNSFLFYPEMTTNGIFISGAIRNQKFYLGPDVAKWYDEIGNQNNSVGCVHAGVLKNSSMVYDDSEDSGESGSEESPEPVSAEARHSGFIHRMFGSEIRLENAQVDRITKCVYSPPLRRKIYDYGLPKLQTDSNLVDGEVSAFVVLTWKNYASTPEEFEGF